MPQQIRNPMCKIPEDLLPPYEHPASVLAERITKVSDDKSIKDAVDSLRRIPDLEAQCAQGLREILALQAEVDAWRSQADDLTHKVICCGVAASHSDATLTRRGAYAGKWDSAQAEQVRQLRTERDQLQAKVQELEASVKKADDQAEYYESLWYLRGGGRETIKSQGARVPDDVLRNSARWRTLMESLPPVNKSHTQMPRVTDHLNDQLTYTGEGLERTVDAIIDERAFAALSTQQAQSKGPQS